MSDTNSDSFPLVSVIIRSMDRPTLADALESIAMQTYPNIEVVLVNAKGFEHQEQGQWCGRFPVFLIDIGEKLPRSRAANMGLDAAHGEYLMFLDDDDWIEADHVQKLADAIMLHPEFKVVYTGARCVDEKKNPLGNKFEKPFNAVQMVAENFIPIHAVLFSRDLIDLGCRLDESMDLYEDWDFWIQLSCHGDFLWVDGLSAVYRITQHTGFGVNADPVLAAPAQWAVYKKWLNRLGDHQITGLIQAVRQSPVKDNQISGLHQAVAERDGQIASLNLSVAEADRQITHINQAVAERDGRINLLQVELRNVQSSMLQAENKIAALMNSNSWRITAGFRWLARSIRANVLQNLATSKVARAAFRGLPVSTKTKLAIKGAAFRYAGWLFRYNPAYQVWREYEQIIHAKNTLDDMQQPDKRPLAESGGATRAGRKILIIDATTPTPDRDSGSLDVFFFMKAFLELGYELTFIPDDLLPLGQYTKNLRTLGVRCLTHEDINSIEDFLRKEGRSLDIVLLYRIHSARLHAPAVKKYAPNAKIVFDTVDLHFLREERQAAIDNSPEAMERAHYTKNAEFEMMRVADATIVLSSVEHDIVLAQDASLNVFTIPYMRDMPGCRAAYAQRRDIVFIGGFKHLPNVDSIKYFVNDIWPGVRDKLPEVKLLVLGSSPPDDVLALGSVGSGIEMVGFVEDIGPYFDACRISIAPLRFGAGIKGKIGTSASYGVPCMATTLAVEGMGLIDGIDVLVADRPELFAEKLATLYNDEKLWNQISGSSLDFVQRNYSYKVGKARLQRLLNSLRVGFYANEILDFTEISSLQEFQNYKLRRQDECAGRGKLERDLVRDARSFALKGYCAVCRKASSFHVDFECSFTDAEGNKYPNWRERLVCAGCELNNRTRAAIHLFRQECAPQKNADIYITEQTTALYAWMKRHYSSVVGSEYSGLERPAGEVGSSGIRHESLTGLSFAASTFDYILSFDVLERIPDFQAAIQECSRVLRPGGQMLFSVPFCFGSKPHIVRARLRDDGSVEHLMEPEYHGDPVNAAGCLCFYHFGWQLLDEFREAGFDSVRALFYWSDKFGYLGLDQALFVAIKHSSGLNKDINHEN